MKFEKSTDIALLVLRLFFGLAMVYGHGWGKLMRFFGEDPLRFGDPIGIGPVPSLVLVTLAVFDSFNHCNGSCRFYSPRRRSFSENGKSIDVLGCIRSAIPNWARLVFLRSGVD